MMEGARHVDAITALQKYKARNPEGWEKASVAASGDIQRRAAATHSSAELPDNVSVDEYIARTLQAQFESKGKGVCHVSDSETVLPADDQSKESMKGTLHTRWRNSQLGVCHGSEIEEVLSAVDQSKDSIEGALHSHVDATTTLQKDKAVDFERWRNSSVAAMADIQRRRAATYSIASLHGNASLDGATLDEYIARTLQAQFEKETFGVWQAAVDSSIRGTRLTAGIKTLPIKVGANSNQPLPEQKGRKLLGSFSVAPWVLPSTKRKNRSARKFDSNEDVCQPKLAVAPYWAPSGNASLPDSEHDRIEKHLAENGLRQLYMDGDGNCQFRSLAHQLYKDPLKHRAVRQVAVREMKSHKAQYSPYVEGSFDEYVKSMGKDGTWGDHISLQAAAEAFKMKILLVTAELDSMIMEVSPVRCKAVKEVTLSYYNGRHFNSTVAVRPWGAVERPKSKARWILKFL